MDEIKRLLAATFTLPPFSIPTIVRSALSDAAVASNVDAEQVATRGRKTEMIEDVEAWKAELLSTGWIVQDGDTSVAQEEGERRVTRYIELVDMVSGEEGGEVFQALKESLQVRHDYGAYQSTIEGLEAFPARIFGQPFLEAYAPLISRQPEWAGDLLISLVKDPERVMHYNAALAEAPSVTRNMVMTYIQSQEDNGWLSDHVGKLRPEQAIANCY